MNKVILCGRLTKDPEVRYTQGEKPTAIARYTLAVDRKFKKDGDASADFIGCVAFGKQAEFAERYLRQGTKIAIVGHIQTGSYTNRDGKKVYTTDVYVDEHEFVESKSSNESGANYSSGYQQQSSYSQGNTANSDGFMNIPDGIDEGLPFS